MEKFFKKKEPPSLPNGTSALESKRLLVQKVLHTSISAVLKDVSNPETKKLIGNTFSSWVSMSSNDVVQSDPLASVRAPRDLPKHLSRFLLVFRGPFMITWSCAVQRTCVPRVHQPFTMGGNFCSPLRACHMHLVRSSRSS